MNRLQLGTLVAGAALLIFGSVAHAKGDAAPAAAISIGAAGAKHPTVASGASGRIHVAYEASEGGGAADVYYLSSSDGGKTWTKPANVSASPGASADPAIAAGKDGSVAIVWTDVSPADPHPDIYLARSTDGGKTWGKPMDVSNTAGVSREPDVRIGADGAIAVIWLDTAAGSDSPDVWATTSHDGGKTWDKPQDVSNTPGKSATPSLALGADKSVNVAWCDTSSGSASPDVYFARSSDGGKTWAAALDVSNSPGISESADVVVDDKGHVFISWVDTSQSEKSPDTMVAASTDGGKTFGVAVNASNSPALSSDPAIAATGDGKVAVVWVDAEGAGTPDVFLATSTDGGKTFSKGRNISNTPGVSVEPDIAITNHKVIAVWQEADGVKFVTSPL